MDGKSYADMIIADIRSGKIDNFAPLIALFKMAGKHLTLDERIQLSPFFKLRTPKQTTIMCGRQVAKSWSVAQRSILMTGMMAGMNTLIVEPRFEQKKRFHAQILNPLLKGCVIRDELIDKRGNDSMDMKTFRNGNFLMLVNSYTSPDSVRGASGISSLLLDECVEANTLINVINNDAELTKKICDVKRGDVLISFKDGAVLYSIAERDASYKGVRSCYQVTTASGRSISCTEGHLLPTNNGKMRLSEIVEYMYGTDEAGLRKNRTVQSCGTGEHQHAAVESQTKTARVRFSQVQIVVRARTRRIVEESESRIQRLLVSVAPDSKKNVSLVVCNDMHESRGNEADTGRARCEKGQGCCCCQERAVSETDESDQGRSCATCETSGNEELLTAVPATYQYDPIVSIEYIGERPVYDIEVVGTHNFILANGLCSYNCQDINNDFIPVLEECCSASDYGIMTYLGTAKTLDGTLAASFERSSQGHWCIRCHHCGKYNIAAPQMELFKMMRSTGLSCAYCSGTLATRTGFFVHAYPSRIEEHVGYHIPQIVFPFHCEREDKWRDVMRKRRELNKTVFLNEVLGVPDDTATRILTLKDLLEARNQLPNTLETAIQERENYDMIVVGVDWTGGGNGTSTTVIAVLGRRFYSGQTDVLYMKRLPQGTHPKIESDTVVQVAQQVRADLIAHDFTGAGWMREALLIGSHAEWATRVYPISYSYKPTANMVTYVDTGIRRSYSVDKTKSLLMTMMAIQYRKITLPMFDALDKSAPQRDFLAIVEQKQELAKGSDVYLLAKSPSFPDDGAHAVNIGFVAMCDVANQYPVFAIDTSKYDMDSVEYNLLTGE